jgi:hypothetical protein
LAEREAAIPVTSEGAGPSAREDVFDFCRDLAVQHGGRKATTAACFFGLGAEVSDVSQ